VAHQGSCIAVVVMAVVMGGTSRAAATESSAAVASPQSLASARTPEFFQFLDIETLVAVRLSELSAEGEDRTHTSFRAEPRPPEHPRRHEASVSAQVGLARSAVADPRPSLRIALDVRDDKSIPLDVVNRAKAEMTLIYRDSGIDVVWTAEAPRVTGPDTPTAPTAASPQVILRILSLRVTDQLPVATTALGFAPNTPERRGRIAYVFYNRIEHIARTCMNKSPRLTSCDSDKIRMLAYVMAHEVGHLLLPAGHSAAGVMGSEWNARNLSLAVHGGLHFNDEEAGLMQAGVRALLAGKPEQSVTQSEITLGRDDRERQQSQPCPAR
jgi:hypothetical protein